MIAFPNGKINLGLQVTRKRADGYHDLQTIFYPIGMNDALEIVPSTRFQFFSSGLTIPGAGEDNLCVRAYGLLKARFPEIPPVKLYLHKHIPMGAGLGGGSADAAFTLRLFNQKFSLGLKETELESMALALGSDCPFFIRDTPSFAEGRGELLEPINLNLNHFSLVLVHPGISISTRWAYSKIIPDSQRPSLKEIISRPIERWKDELENDFEKPISIVYPILKQIKTELYQAGAMYAAMSGSGSSFFGIFPKGQTIGQDFIKNYRDGVSIDILP